MSCHMRSKSNTFRVFGDKSPCVTDTEIEIEMKLKETFQPFTRVLCEWDHCRTESYPYLPVSVSNLPLFSFYGLG